MSLADATGTGHPPFSNGTERYAWTSAWCDHCEHDHSITHDEDDVEPYRSCDLLLGMDLADYGKFAWPEAWVPEPTDGRFELPSRMVCLKFKPCHVGDCDGDPYVETRVSVRAEVEAYWKGQR